MLCVILQEEHSWYNKPVNKAYLQIIKSMNGGIR